MKIRGLDIRGRAAEFIIIHNKKAHRFYKPKPKAVGKMGLSVPNPIKILGMDFPAPVIAERIQNATHSRQFSDANQLTILSGHQRIFSAELVFEFFQNLDYLFHCLVFLDFKDDCFYVSLFNSHWCIPLSFLYPYYTMGWGFCQPPIFT